LRSLLWAIEWWNVMMERGEGTIKYLPRANSMAGATVMTQ